MFCKAQGPVLSMSHEAYPENERPNHADEIIPPIPVHQTKGKTKQQHPNNRSVTFSGLFISCLFSVVVQTAELQTTVLAVHGRHPRRLRGRTQWIVGRGDWVGVPGQGEECHWGAPHSHWLPGERWCRPHSCCSECRQSPSKMQKEYA